MIVGKVWVVWCTGTEFIGSDYKGPVVFTSLAAAINHVESHYGKQEWSRKDNHAGAFPDNYTSVYISKEDVID